jgi:hypothetical protein
MQRMMIGTVLILGGMLRPKGHDRSMAAKRADGRRCGASPGGRSFDEAKAPNMRECMWSRGWALDHIIPDPATAHARARNSEDDSPPPPIDNSSNDDSRRQQDQDNLQQMLNTQQMLNDQQMMINQQQQQISDDMNR